MEWLVCAFFTHEDSSNSQVVRSRFPDGAPIPGLDPLADLSSDDTMLYGRVASGYRPGGPNVALAGAPLQVDADSLVNYELGLKSQFSERVFASGK